MGFPEIVVTAAALILLGIGVGWGLSRRKQFSRFCPKCGRGLRQPKEATRCAYCGNPLP